ncbi:MAG TPA: hypothetical protein VLY84_04950 [Dysgonamonadaceae bacterium]|nr:hypothetical protein [Dysgonamonadaceae bacterium]
MYTTYHLDSAQDVTTDLLDSIKATFKSKPIIITVEENDGTSELTDEMKEILDERLLEDESTDMSAEGFFNELKERYGL